MRHIQPFLLLSLLVILTACATSESLIKNLMPLDGNPHSFRNINYTASDELAGQLQDILPGQVPMTEHGLTPIPMAGNELPPGSPFPQLVMDQVTARLQQHGYRVAKGVPSAGKKAKDSKQVTLVGDYLKSGNDIVIHLEVVEEKNGRLLAAHDYTVPVTPEVAAILVPGGVLPEPVMHAEGMVAPDPTSANAAAAGAYFAGQDSAAIPAAPSDGAATTAETETEADSDAAIVTTGPLSGMPKPASKPVR